MRSFLTMFVSIQGFVFAIHHQKFKDVKKQNQGKKSYENRHD